MKANAVPYSNISEKRVKKFRLKEERTELEHALKEWLKESRFQSYMLMGILILMVGLFLMLFTYGMIK